MNKQVRNLYVAIGDNKVIHASTSLSEFISTISGLLTNVNSLSYYQKEFKTKPRLEHVDNLRKLYYFQKVK